MVALTGGTYGEFERIEVFCAELSLMEEDVGINEKPEA